MSPTCICKSPSGHKAVIEMTRKRQRNKMGIVSLSGVISTLLSVATGSDQVDDMGRIVGGFTSEKGAYPFFVRIDSSEGLSKCGGSLIAPDIVLTAAHCKKETTESFQVAVNGYAAPFVTNDDAVYLSVLESLQHPDFVPETYHNDFMVLKLEAAVDLNLMTPVQLNQASILPAQGELLRVVGLGVLREDGPTPNFLQEVEIPVIDTAPCKQAYANLNIDIVDDNVMFCMEDVGKDSCQGDSGGPVLNSSGFQVGVVSFGFGCAKEGFPGVYARVSAGYNWIKETVCQLSEVNPEMCIDSSVTVASTAAASLRPSAYPTLSGSLQPSPGPSVGPTVLQTVSSSAPSPEPSSNPSNGLTAAPTLPPSTIEPTSPPTSSPTGRPTDVPTFAPPTLSPSTVEPTSPPTSSPTKTPTDAPTALPTATPSTILAAKSPSVSISPNLAPSMQSSDPSPAPTRTGVSMDTMSTYLHDSLDSLAILQDMTQAPNPRDECRDEENAIFLVFLEQETDPELRGCQWLQEHPGIKSSICVESHDAFKVCRETCVSCAGEQGVALKASDAYMDELKDRLPGEA